MKNRPMEGQKVYLASNSPRRRELLSLCGLKFDILTPQVDEKPVPGEDGVAYVRRIAQSKVLAAAKLVIEDAVIIAADTAVIDRGNDGSPRILGKPRHPAEAVEMLQGLRAHTHQVHTALSILSVQAGAMLSDLCTTNVLMRNYTDDEIETYVASGDPLDKAGAYAIQHAGLHPVERLDGCYANVMGLPLCHLARTLNKIRIEPPANVPHTCQAALGYNCPVYAQILGENVQAHPG